MNFKQISILDLKHKLSRLRRRRQIQTGNLSLVCTNQGEIVCFAMPIAATDNMQFESTEQMSLTDFVKSDRSTFPSNTCLYLTYHTRPIIAIVNPANLSALDLPLIGNLDLVLGRESA